MIWENLKMALTSLKNAKLRSLLTMLGIIIGVATVTSVVAVGQGVKQSVAGEVNGLGTNLLQVNPGQAFSSDENGQQGGFNPTASLGASTLTEADLVSIRQTSQVQAAAPLMIVSGIAEAGGKQAQGGFLLATTPDYIRVVDKPVAIGQFFSQPNTKEAVLGGTVAEQLFGTNSPLGQTITIRQQKFRVVGVLEKPKTDSLLGGGGLDSAILIPFDTAKAFSGGAANIIEIDAKITSADQVNAVKGAITDTLKANHGGQADFTVLTQEEQLKVFDSILAILTSFIGAIAAISLLVGGIGIMNIMLVSVTERTREIGIRRALGATRTTIMAQFLIEAVVISLIGGGLGVLAAFGQGLLVERLAKIAPVFTVPTVAMAVGVSAAVGIIFGLAPAIKAARKSPIEALRYE